LNNILIQFGALLKRH